MKNVFRNTESRPVYMTYAPDLAIPGASGDAEAFVGLALEDGRNACVCDGVQRALGREPTDFSEFARRPDASGAWRAAA